MTPRWNPIVVQEDAGVTLVFDGGRMMPGLNIAAQDEDVDQVRLGYRCINCWEPLEEAFPKNCFLCGFPIREHQPEHFARAYKGYDPTIRTGADLERVADEMAERAERRAWAKRARESGIVLGGKSVGAAIKRMKGGS